LTYCGGSGADEDGPKRGAGRILLSDCDCDMRTDWFNGPDDMTAEEPEPEGEEDSADDFGVISSNAPISEIFVRPKRAPLTI
jgi:hypothetical protein